MKVITYRCQNEWSWYSGRLNETFQVEDKELIQLYGKSKIKIED